jgi:hypothetical protein
MSSPRRSLAALARAVALVGILSVTAFAGVLPVAAAGAAEGGSPAADSTVSQGYWLVAADGTAYAFGDAELFGSNRNQGPDIVGMARTPGGDGYWMVDEDGDVFHYGKAASLGSRVYNADDVVGFAARPRGAGYWMVASDGGIFSFGDAGFFGSTGAIALNQPIVGMAATPSGNGYWLVASDGGIFSFGDAAFHGSTGAVALNQPIVGMAATPSGKGYWLVASDGGIFAFGDANFEGSTGAIRLNRPIVGMASTGTGRGYWLAASDGGIFTFGDATFQGSAGAMTLPQPIISVVAGAADQRPVAVPDKHTLDEDTSAVIAVLDNDSGLGDGPIAVTVEEGPAHGTAAAAADGRITYIPARDYTGSDSVVYRVVDADGDETTGTVSLTVTGRNDAPLVADLSLTTDAGLAVTGQIIATDADGDPLTFTLSTPAGHGTVTVDGSGAFLYTPDLGFIGSDGFVIHVDDGHGGTAASAISVSLLSVLPIDDQPVAVADAASGTEDLPVVVDVAANDTGLSDGGVVVSVNAATLDPATEGTATVDGGAVTLNPAANVNGAVTFDYTISDADGDTATATVTVTLEPVNDAPTVSAISDVTLPFGSHDSGPIAFTVGDVDNPLGSLTVTATSSNEAFVPDSGLELDQGPQGQWTLVVNPVHREAGTSTITVTVSDGTASAAASFVVTILPR